MAVFHCTRPPQRVHNSSEQLQRPRFDLVLSSSSHKSREHSEDLMHPSISDRYLEREELGDHELHPRRRSSHTARTDTTPHQRWPAFEMAFRAGPTLGTQARATCDWRDRQAHVNTGPFRHVNMYKDVNFARYRTVLAIIAGSVIITSGIFQLRALLLIS